MFKDVRLDSNFILGSVQSSNGEWQKFKYNRKTYKMVYIQGKNPETNLVEQKCRELSHKISCGLLRSNYLPFSS